VDFTMRIMKMDRETALRSYEIMAGAWEGTGIPTRTGIENIVRGIKSQGRFPDKKASFEDVADPRFALQVARELGAKTE